MPLAWGRHYVMVEPTPLPVDYVINPFMDPGDQPDRGLALAQWHTLVETIERLGGTVDVIPQRPDAPDMVYAMNLGLAVARRRGDGGLEPHVVMSHMRYPQRRMETASAQPWFADARLHHVVRRPARHRRPPRVGRRLPVRRRARRRLRAAHRGARAQAPGRGPRGPGARPADHPPGHVPPRPGLLPARRPPRDRLPRRARPGLGRRAAVAWCPSRWCSPRRRR